MTQLPFMSEKSLSRGSESLLGTLELHREKGQSLRRVRGENFTYGRLNHMTALAETQQGSFHKGWLGAATPT